VIISLSNINRLEFCIRHRSKFLKLQELNFVHFLTILQSVKCLANLNYVALSGVHVQPPGTTNIRDIQLFILFSQWTKEEKCIL